MTNHRKHKPISEEWLSLETSIALLGQKIADRVPIYNQEKSKANPDLDLLSQLKTELLELGRARQECYRHPTL